MIQMYVKRFISCWNSLTGPHYRSQKHEAVKTSYRCIFKLRAGWEFFVFCKFVLNNAISTYIDISEVISIIDRHPCIDDILDTGVSMTFLVSRLLSVPIWPACVNRDVYIIPTLSLPVSSLFVQRLSIWVTVFCLGKVILLHSEAVLLYCNR